MGDNKIKYEEIYEILKGQELESFYAENKMIPRYNYPKLISEILKAIEGKLNIKKNNRNYDNHKRSTGEISK